MPCHAIRSANDLNSRPSIDPLDLVDTKTLLTIGVTDSGINVMVVKNPTQARIIVYTLTTRSIDVSVRRQNNSTTTVGTALSTLIHETTGSRVGSADLDLVFLAGGRAILVETAADTLAEEHVVATVLAYSNPLSCSGTCTNAHDPSLIKRTSDGTYFRFSTGGGIAIHTASSIQGPWVYKGQVLPNGANVANSGKTDLWAPDVSLVGSTYYLYYTASSFGTQNSVIGLATSSTMDVGSWSDKGSSKSLYIDPSIIPYLSI